MIFEILKFTYRMGLDSTTGQTEYGTENLYALYYEGTPNGEGMGASSPFAGQYGEYSIIRLAVVKSTKTSCYL